MNNTGAANKNTKGGQTTSRGGRHFVDFSTQHTLIKEILPDICNWKFPIFKLQQNAGGLPLFYMSYALFLYHDLLNKFSIPEKKLVDLLKKLNEGYHHSNPYHNALHAADVAQTLNFFITRGGLAGLLTDTDIFAAILSAIVHDFQHPGFNNAFMINSKSELAIRYNDLSVLENHHVSAAFQLMSQPEYNIFENCSFETYKEIRETVIKSVLATDFSKHFDILGQFKSEH